MLQCRPGMGQGWLRDGWSVQGWQGWSRVDWEVVLVLTLDPVYCPHFQESHMYTLTALFQSVYHSKFSTNNNTLYLYYCMVLLLQYYCMALQLHCCIVH